MAAVRKWRVTTTLASIRALIILGFGFLAVATPAKGDVIYPENPFVTGDAIFVTGVGLSRFNRDFRVSPYTGTWVVLPGLLTFEPVVAAQVVLVGSSNGLYAIDRETGAAAPLPASI